MKRFITLLFGHAAELLIICTTSAILAGVSFGQAQATAADLTGTVVDPNGAVVSGATVTARQVATGFVRTTTTGDDGSYKLIGLPPGEYEIGAEAATFKKVLIAPIRLTVGQSAELTIK